jgi:membrane-bound lytic murein transglycosylase B
MPIARLGARRRSVSSRTGRVLRTRALPAAAVLAVTLALPGQGLDATFAAVSTAAHQAGLAQGFPGLGDLAAGALRGLDKDLLKLAAGVDLASGDGSGDTTLAADPGRRLLTAGALDAGDIPEVAMRAYGRAERVIAMSDPQCGLTWSLLAAIGRVESNHGRYQGVTLRADGFGSRPIRGVPLDGRGGVARVADTDRGALDGDVVVDRAVGPMQFIPATWKSVGVDADGDGTRNPDNIFDAALATGVYLCAGDTDLTDPAQLRDALHRYNPSEDYVDLVIRLARAYAGDGGPTGPGYRIPGGYRPGRGGAPDRGGVTFDREFELPPLARPLRQPANPAPPPAMPPVPPPTTTPTWPAPPTTSPTTSPPTTAPTSPTWPTVPSGPTSPTATTVPPRDPTDPTTPPECPDAEPEPTTTTGSTTPSTTSTTGSTTTSSTTSTTGSTTTSTTSTTTTTTAPTTTTSTTTTTTAPTTTTSSTTTTTAPPEPGTCPTGG